MACATLKRNRDWNPLNCSEERLKRRRCLPTTPLSSADNFDTKSAVYNSPFNGVVPELSSSEVFAKVRCGLESVRKRKRPRTSELTDEEQNLQKLCSKMAIPLEPARQMFSFEQVTLVCQTVLRERERELREEYDRVLSAKLAEQYDTYVRFTYDQIQKKFGESLPSYLS